MRSILLCLNSQLWEEKRVVEWKNSFHNKKSVLIFTVQFNYFTFLLLSYGLSFSGWCTLRESISLKETGEIIFASVFLVFGISISNFVTDYSLGIVCLISTTIGILWYVKVISDFAVILFTLQEIEGEVSQRSTLVTKFLIASCSTFFTMLMLQSSAVTFELHPLVPQIIIEIGIFTLTLIQMYFFMLKGQYRGNEALKDDELQLEAGSFDAVNLIEPTDTQIVLISL